VVIGRSSGDRDEQRARRWAEHTRATPRGEGVQRHLFALCVSVGTNGEALADEADLTDSGCRLKRC
jgi:hypothetical protein